MQKKSKDDSNRIQILDPDGLEKLDNNDDSESDLSASASESDKDEEQKQNNHLKVSVNEANDQLSERSKASSRRRKNFGDNRSAARQLEDIGDFKKSDEYKGQ